MTIRQKTADLILAAAEILAEYRPMTVRQIFYQLVSKQIIPNTRGSYQKVSNALVHARKEGLIPWDWIEDRLRRPRSVSMWDGLASFSRTVQQAYRRDVWKTQPAYIECWLEKDALSGIFEDILDPYGVTLNVGRGYDGWDSIRNAALRYEFYGETTILYFGDFDPSGEDMVRSLEARLMFFDCAFELIKTALTKSDIETYDLPPDFTKKTDTRAAKFVAEHGDISVELDALPIEVLRKRIRDEVEAHMDMSALKKIRRLEKKERRKIVKMFDG